VDLRLYGRVIWRFRLIVLAGFVLAVALSFLSVAHVSLKHGISYRRPATYSSSATIFFTQKGSAVPGPNGVPNYLPSLVNPNMFAGNSTAYATIATSDAVLRLMLRHGPLPGAISATPMTQPGLGTTLPFITLSGLSNTPQRAVDAARRGIQGLTEYFKIEQDAANVPADQRIILEVFNAPTGAVLLSGHSFTRPLVIFLAAMMAVLGLTFVLENLRPRVRPIESATRPLAAGSRRSA
jgi:hypothetical protein